MPSFDYIESKELRESLESDYAELNSCASNESWKGVQVLAGSIVEALLVDYMTSAASPSRTTKDPLKMDLSEAISVCKAEGVLSERTSELCGVIRSYRNLIHPGRMVRLGEPAPDKGSGTIALALVDIITQEIATRRRATVGFTAEQLLSKLIRDSSSLSLLKHLLQEVAEPQRKRLLMDLIPEAYFEAINDDFDSSSERLKVAYRAIVDSTSDATRADIAHKFVEVLRDGDGGYVSGYSDAFFLAYDLDFVPKNHIAMVKDHVLDRSPKQHTKHSIEQLRGIEGHLEPTDAMRWFDPIIMTLTAKSVAHDVKVIVRNYCLDSFFSTRTDFDSALEIRIREWIEHYKKLNSVENMNFTIALKDEIEGRIIKF